MESNNLDSAGQPPPDSQPPPEWKRRWIDWRNRVLASPRFQAQAARWPVLRRVARRRAAGLFDLIAGFTYTQTALAAVESGLLELLAHGPCRVEDLAANSGVSRDAALRLLRAAGAIDLAEEVSPGWWMLGQQGTVLHGDPGMQAMIRHHRLLYADLADPLALLRADRTVPTRLSDYWAYQGDRSIPGSEAAAADYSALMAASQRMVAEQVLPAYDLSRHGSLLDVGGGHGAFATAVARHHPQQRLGIFDLPPVLAGTAGVLESAGLSARIALHGGDFFRDPLPAGYDCISLVRILHDHDDEPCLMLLRAVRAALAPRGTVLIAEPMAATNGAKAMGDGYFGLYLWAMGRGRPRRPDELGALLQQAGFTHHRPVTTRLPLVASLIVASI